MKGSKHREEIEKIVYDRIFLHLGVGIVHFSLEPGLRLLGPCQNVGLASNKARKVTGPKFWKSQRA